MKPAKHSTIVIALTLMLVLWGCSLIVPEINAQLSDLTLCQGWDAADNAIALPDPIPSDETRICIRGHLETNADILLQITWARERKALLRHREVFGNGAFLSCIEQDGGFEPGGYGVSVMMGKEVLGLVEFTVNE